ncbi:MAG: hypothetical protein QXZ09_08260 [Candidatus Methanomethylicaceae archaeon]
MIAKLGVMHLVFDSREFQGCVHACTRTLSVPDVGMAESRLDSRYDRVSGEQEFLEEFVREVMLIEGQVRRVWFRYWRYQGRHFATLAVLYDEGGPYIWMKSAFSPHAACAAGTALFLG